jgi:hypothetical protein
VHLKICNEPCQAEQRLSTSASGDESDCSELVWFWVSVGPYTHVHFGSVCRAARPRWCAVLQPSHCRLTRADGAGDRHRAPEIRFPKVDNCIVNHIQLLQRSMQDLLARADLRGDPCEIRCTLKNGTSTSITETVSRKKRDCSSLDFVSGFLGMCSSSSRTPLPSLHQSDPGVPPKLPFESFRASGARPDVPLTRTQEKSRVHKPVSVEYSIHDAQKI